MEGQVSKELAEAMAYAERPFRDMAAYARKKRSPYHYKKAIEEAAAASIRAAREFKGEHIEDTAQNKEIRGQRKTEKKVEVPASFTEEQITAARGLIIMKNDLEHFGTFKGYAPTLALTKATRTWNSLTGCYWWTEDRPHPLSVMQPPILPELPLDFAETAGYDERDRWGLNFGSLLEFLNAYYAYRTENPDMLQSEILSRHFEGTDMRYLHEFAEYGLAKAHIVAPAAPEQ